MFLDFATAAMVAARGALMVARTWLGSLGGGRP
jgi:hypothetical protein